MLSLLVDAMLESMPDETLEGMLRINSRARDIITSGASRDEVRAQLAEFISVPPSFEELDLPVFVMYVDSAQARIQAILARRRGEMQ